MILLLMALLTIAPLEDATRAHRLKTPVVSALRSADWERVALGLRNSAQFSAGVENIRVMARVQRDLDRAIAGTRDEFGRLTDRAKFIAELQSLARREGLDTGPRGTLRDFGNERRLELIYRQQAGQAFGYSRWKAGQDEDLLNAFPAQELIRVEQRLKERDWRTRWQAAGGQLWGGRMIALKQDPVWTGISRFGNPWPPYDFGSGMGVEDVSRSEAVQLGLIQPTQRFTPDQGRDLDANLQADASTWSQAERNQLAAQFGDQITFKGGKAVWQGQRLKEFVADVLADRSPHTAAIWLGDASPRATTLAGAAGGDVAGKKLIMAPDAIKHIWSRHAATEADPRQRPVSALDFELIPHVWREPDSVLPGDQPGDLVFQKDILGRQVLVTWQTRGQSVSLRTMYVKKEAVQ